MGHARTLLRKMTKRLVELPDGQIATVDALPRPQRTKPGTAFRRVTTVPGAPPGIDHTYHATKGHRFIRIAL